MRIKTKWRLMVTATLVLYVLLVATIFWWLVHNLVLVAVLVVAAVGFAHAGWIIFTASRKWTLGRYLTVACNLLVAGMALIYIVRNNSGALRHVALFVGLSSVYLLLLARLRMQYWQRLRVLNMQRRRPRFRKPFLIVNPKSGDGRAIREHIPRLAEDMGIRILLTRKGDDVEKVARRAVARGADALGISGGDGSLGAVAKVAIEHGLPMVVVPGGTRCHFARDIGLDPKRIVDALQGFQGVERRVDVASVNGRIVMNNVAFGLYADIIDHPDYRWNKRDLTRRVLRDLLDGTKRAYSLRFRYKNQNFYKAIQILVGINRYTTLDVFEMGHRERLDEGILQVTAITSLDDSLVTKLLSAMSIGRLRKGYMPADVYQWVTQKFIVGAPSDVLVMGVDGEREEYTVPVTITLMPRALRLFVPAEGVRGRPGNPFGAPIAGKLWRALRGRK
jgi:diacylglycerol kinase family enzyme